MVDYALLLLLNLLGSVFSESVVLSGAPCLRSVQGSCCRYYLDDDRGLVLGFSTDFPNELARIVTLRPDSNSRRSLSIHGVWNCHVVHICYDKERPLLLEQRRLEYTRHSLLLFEEFNARCLCDYKSLHDIYYTVTAKFLDAIDTETVKSGKSAVDPGCFRHHVFCLGNYALDWHAHERSPFGTLMFCVRDRQPR